MERILKSSLPAGRIIRIEELPDGTYEVIQKVKVEEEIKSDSKVTSIDNSILNDTFVLIEAEELSLSDKFLKYSPRNYREQEAKELIIKAITAGVENFYVPRYDPSFTEDGKGICFVAGMLPAVGKGYAWNARAAREYMPERNSRLGTRMQYAAFLGVFIKKLVAQGQTLERAWHSVCKDSTELGHYTNSKRARQTFELTGSRGIYGFYDLGNTNKLLDTDNNEVGLWIAGGNYSDYGDYCPIASVYRNDLRKEFTRVVAWVVLS